MHAIHISRLVYSCVMDYQVPQFIEVEDKIVGPLTLRQFIYLAGGAGLAVILFIYLPPWVAFPFIALVAAASGMLAFYKVNGKHFIEILEAGFNYYVGAKLFLWRHEAKSGPPAGSPGGAAVAPLREQGPISVTPKLTRGKLSELAWSLDVKTPGGSPDELES